MSFPQTITLWHCEGLVFLDGSEGTTEDRKLHTNTGKTTFFISRRIEEEYLRSQKRQKELLGEWKNCCNSTLKWIADTAARVQAQDTIASDLDHARAQRQEIEVGDC